MTHILDGKKAIIFDLDGTLVDSMWMWKRIDIEFLARYGHECPPGLQRVIEGMSFSETAVYFKERFQLPLTLEEIKEAWTEMSIDKYRRQVPAKRGAKEFLSYVSKRGILCGIATSNSREMVDAVLASLDMRRFFRLWLRPARSRRESRSRISTGKRQRTWGWNRGSAWCLRMCLQGFWRGSGEA